MSWLSWGQRSVKQEVTDSIEALGELQKASAALAKALPPASDDDEKKTEASSKEASTSSQKSNPAEEKSSEHYGRGGLDLNSSTAADSPAIRQLKQQKKEAQDKLAEYLNKISEVFYGDVADGSTSAPDKAKY